EELTENTLGFIRNFPPAQRIPEDFFSPLQQLLSSDHTWIGLIIPSRQDKELDRLLCSNRLLDHLIYKVRWGSPGILLQPESVGVTSDPVVLLDVFPAFRAALKELTKWPGLLFWTDRGDAEFFSFPSRSEKAIKESAAWILSNIRLREGQTLQQLKMRYSERYPSASIDSEPTTTLLHISDLHIGSWEARERIPRLQQLLRDIVAEIPKGNRIIPVLSGDIIDSPNKEYYHSARQFVDFLHNMNTEPPITVLGNHDVRKDGYHGEDLGIAFRMPTDRLRWEDHQGICLVSFNSVTEGKLARGMIGTDQILDIGNAIDRKKNCKDYILIGILHHHPIPVEEPSWYAKPF